MSSNLCDSDCEKSVGTTELHYSTKKREHSFSILINAKRLFPLFRAIDSDCAINLNT